VSQTRIPILYLAPWVDFGGSDKGTIDWFKWLDRSRFSPSLITTQPSPNRRLAEVLPFADEVWPLPELFAGERFPAFIVDFIVSRQIDVVHIMNSRLGYNLLPDLRSLDRRPKIVVQLHVEEDTRDGYVRYVTTRYGNLVDAFSVTSEHLAEAVHGYGVSRNRIEVIPTGVDAITEFSPDRVQAMAGLDPELVHILFPGRLVPQKDPLLMVDVARELDARGLRFKIHVVGDGELECDVRQRVAAHGLGDRVRFESSTNDLASWYAATDLLLMTSVFEGVPYVAYEALAMQLPVVAPALPGNVELMAAVGGTLVGRREVPTAYADALEPLIRDGALRARVGQLGRELMLERYGLAEMADGHAHLYDKLLAGRELEPTPVFDSSVPLARFGSRPSRGRPLVSVVTPCFNHGGWLRECVESVRGQSYSEVEMIVVDDGSTEVETLSYLEELEQEDAVRVLRMKRNSGPSAARNRGLEQVQGRYILPVDADNLLLPDAVSRLVSQLQGAGERIGYVYPTIQYFGNREDYFEPPAFNGWLLTKGNYIDTCALIDRSVFDAGHRYPEEIVLGHEDWDFFLTLLEKGIYGEPARGKTLRYRKHGYTRSDVVDWSFGRFHGSVPGRHPGLFADQATQTRGENPQVHMKAQWAPALTVIALAPMEHDSPAWAKVRQGLAEQRFRDFELRVAIDSEPPVSPAMPPVRMLPMRPHDCAAQTLVDALERTASPHVAVTYGTGAELLADPGSLERLARLLEHGAASGVIGFANGSRAGRFPWCVLPGDDPSIELHSIAWSRRHLPLRSLPFSLDETDPIGDLGRWYQLRRISVDWRHLPLTSPLRARSTGRRRALPEIPRSRQEISGRHARIDAETWFPGPFDQVPRWEGLRTWAPPCTLTLARHRRIGHNEWTVTTSELPPDDFEFDRLLGLMNWMAFEGTARIVTDEEHGYRRVERGDEPDALELEDSLGYADQVAFPLLEPLMLCRHSQTGAHVMVCGDDDPLRAEVHWPQVEVLGWIERWPVNPTAVPRSGESTAWLRGLIRTIDYPARRHRMRVGAAGIGEHPWELGALLDRDPGGGIPVWIDRMGRLHTDGYEARDHPLSAQATLRWIGAPATWRGFGRHVPRARAVARRGVEAVRQKASSFRSPAVPNLPVEPEGWLLPEDGPHRLPIYSAVHAVTSDQLVTRDRSEPRELGYGSARLLGYALSAAPATGSLERPAIGIPWGSRFGQVLSRVEDPLRPDA
jgi:glycosyltransferase involved in cell wall biosynthesis